MSQNGFLDRAAELEELAAIHRHIANMADQHGLPFEIMEVGRIWDSRVEIDVAALDKRSRSVLLGECRWRSRKMGITELERLLEKASRLTKVRDFKQHLVLFSRAGFTAALRKRAEHKGVLLVEGELVSPPPP